MPEYVDFNSLKQHRFSKVSSLRNKKFVDRTVSRSDESRLQLCLDPLDLSSMCWT